MIEIKIEEKIASLKKYAYIVNDNTNYLVHFDFDEEWAEYEAKTARFVHNGQYTDVVFTGNEVSVPMTTNSVQMEIGVYAGNLRTTTPVIVPVLRSIIGNESEHPEPEEDIYNQLVNAIDLVASGKADGLNYEGNTLQLLSGDEILAEVHISGGGGGGDGTYYHNQLYNRDMSNQHPISAITNLTESLNGKVDKASGKGLSTNDLTNALKDKIESALQEDDISDMATKTWTNAQGFLTEHQSLDAYATKTWVEGKGYLTEHQSLEGYATETFVTNAIASAIADIDELVGSGVI